MNIFTRFTARAMKENPRRSLVTLVGVILSAAMFTAVTTFGYSLWTFLKESAIAKTGDYHVRCDWLSEEEVTSLEENPAIHSVAQYSALGYLKTQEDSNGPLSTFVVAAADATYYKTMPVRLSQGRYPENSKEVLLPEEILSILEHYGWEASIGSRVSWTLLRQCEDYYQTESLEGLSPSFPVEYTVVGYIREDTLLINNGLDTYPILTLADGTEGSALWYRAYVKTAPQKVWDLIQGTEFHDIEVNETLLSLYGQSRYENFTSVILWLSVVLCVIIVIGSVSLIYNSFSISLSERTKQFGLLSCIGATKGQIRRAVYAEALLLAIPGIPLGVVFGYSGISLTLYFLRDGFHLILGSYAQQEPLRGVPSVLALSFGGCLALLTLLLSAALPAKRATSISPLAAVRQHRDYVVPKKAVSLRSSLFGLPGALAKSYYRVSKGKYRATLISLVISLVLFLSATGFTTGLKETADQAINEESYDFASYVSREDSHLLAEQDFVVTSAYVAEDYFRAQISGSQRSVEFLRYEEEIEAFYEQAVSSVADIYLYYLEDKVLEAYLKEQCIDPKAYLDPQNPRALVCYKEITTYMHADKNGIYTRYTYQYPPLSPEVSELLLFPDRAPKDLNPFGIEEGHSYGYSTDGEGNLILILTPYTTNEHGNITEDSRNALSYLVQWLPGDRSDYTGVYYLLDKETGKPADSPAYTEEINLMSLSIGATIRELPFGISQRAKDSPYYTALILPLSAAPQELWSQGSLHFTVSDYHEAKVYLQSNVKENLYIDYCSQEEAARSLILVVNIFSYGFIVLICLICIANIFNTLSTNVALRRRDFSMLKSIGFCAGDLRKMLGYECLLYGCKALLWGLPLGLLANFGIQKIVADIGTISYTFPWESILSAVFSVFIIVFSTMFYAASKLRKDNLVEAIRHECI